MIRAGVISSWLIAAMKSGQPTKGEWRVVWADGERSLLDRRALAGFYGCVAGEPSKMNGVNIDVTERKLADEARLEVNRTLEAQAAFFD